MILIGGKIISLLYKYCLISLWHSDKWWSHCDRHTWPAVGLFSLVFSFPQTMLSMCITYCICIRC